MQAFEFVMVPVALVLGLGLTHLLEAFARGLKREFTPGPVHGLWTLLTAILIIQQFWSRWELVGREDWTIVQLVLFLLPALLAYLAAALLAPPDGFSGDIDEYFLARRRPFFVTSILLMGSYTLEDRLNLGELNLDIDAIRLAVVVLYFVGISSTRKSVQLAAATATIALLVMFTLGWTFSLSSFAAS